MADQKIIKTTQNSYPYGQLFDFEMMMVKDTKSRVINSKWQWVARIFILENTTTPLKMGFSVENLPLGEYYFRFLPLPRLQSNNSTYNNRKVLRLGVLREEFSEPTGVMIYDSTTKTNKEIKLKGCWVANDLKSGNMASKADVYHRTGEGLFNEISKFDNTDLWYAKFLPSYVDPETETWSSDQTPPITITSVSELVNIPFPVTNYDQCSVFATRLQASERIQTIPSIIQDITKGRKIKKIKYVDKVHGINGNVITNGSGYTQPVLRRQDLSEPVYIEEQDKILNLRTGFTGNVFGVNATEIGIDTFIDLKIGDYFLIYTEESSSYFPDIFLDLISGEKGGLGSIFIGYEHLDMMSIFRAKQFCYWKSYFWDGVIDNQTPFASWAIDQSKSSRLLATRINGQFGLIAEDEKDLPVAVFNETNIIKGSYQEIIRPHRETDLDRVVINFLDGYSTLKPVKSIVIEYSKGGNKPLRNTYSERQIEFPSITRPRQALEIGASILKSARLQRKIINFKTSFQGLFVNIGDLIIVQHRVSEIDEEKSGRILEIISRTSNTTVVRISKPIEKTFAQSLYTLSFHNLSTNTITQNLNCSNINQPPDCLFISGTGNQSIQVGDVFVMSKESATDTLFKVNSILPSDDYQCSIDAIEWHKDIFNLEDIYTEPPLAGILDYKPDRESNDILRIKKQEWFWETSDSTNRILDDQIIE